VKCYTPCAVLAQYMMQFEVLYSVRNTNGKENVNSIIFYVHAWPMNQTKSNPKPNPTHTEYSISNCIIYHVCTRSI